MREKLYCEITSKMRKKDKFKTVEVEKKSSKKTKKKRNNSTK